MGLQGKDSCNCRRAMSTATFTTTTKTVETDQAWAMHLSRGSLRLRGGVPDLGGQFPLLSSEGLPRLG